MNSKFHENRSGVVCACIVTACLWVAHPVAEMGFIDDWSYIKTAQTFAQTGHFVYNGWATAMLGWQVVWCALFIKLFGFSYTVARLSVVSVALATIFLFHATLVRFGVNARNSVFGALTLGLSPLFMPMAASYMTDVPGLFVVVLCLYLCQRAVAACSNKAAIAWLCLAAASNVVGGTVRQIAWLGALVMVPATAWLLRKRHGILLTSLLLWALSAAAIFLCMRWFARQPYSIPEPIFKAAVFGHADFIIGMYVKFVSALACLLLVVFPILVAWLLQVRHLSRAALLRTAAVISVWGLFQWKTGWIMPWIPSILQSEFAVPRTDLWVSPISLVLPIWMREAISLLVIATAWILLERHDLWSTLENTKPKSISSRKTDAVQAASWHSVLWLLGPFSLVYFALLTTRVLIFDRYLLAMMPLAIICLLMLYQRKISATLPIASMIALAIFALSAICGTHDWFAWNRARFAAIDEIRASGVPRTRIQGGFEYDGWTQIEDGGYINDSRLKVPAGAYRPGPRLQSGPNECISSFASYTPVVQPEFSTLFWKKMPCLAPSDYPPVSYRTWLPPYKGMVYIQKIPDSSN